MCVSLVLAYSCKSVNHVSNSPVVPQDFHVTDKNLDVDSTQSIATIPYRDFFNDSNLLALIDSVLLFNNDLQIAMKQIDIADEAMKQARWGYFPQIGVGLGVATINRPSDNSMNGIMASQFMGKKYIEDYTSSVNISWEADIWGKIKGRKEMALAGYLQTQEATKAIQTRLISTVASGYYNLLMLDLQKEISLSNVKLMEEMLRMTKIQQELGMTTLLAVQQQESNRDQVLKTLPVLDEYIRIQENALRALAGQLPGDVIHRGQLTDMQLKGGLAIGVPAEMLALRPDVRSAELEMKKALAHVNVSRANMYPSLMISAQGGLNAFKGSDWFKVPGSLFGTLTGSLAQPILAGRQLKTAYNQAKIGAEQVELQFKESVLQAVVEVTNVLTTISSLQQQEEILIGLVDRNEKMVKNADKLFKNDMASYLEVILAQQSKLQAEIEAAALKNQRLLAEVNLYRALGGGRY